jgi:hypothetical protein
MLTLSLALPPMQAQDATPELRDDPGSARARAGIPPMAFGIFFAILFIGIGLGLFAVVVIRRWDRSVERARDDLPPKKTSD